ncbi:MAG: hypothetical protein RI894_777 [Bacteroidota bacterium]|jgi:hypothetical protein
MKYLGYCIFGLLLILSIVFYMDRMMMPDTSFLVTNILYDGTLQIQVQRFVAVFTQIVPYIFAKLGLPLKFILIGYSTSFVLFYTAFYTVFTEWFKEERWAWVVLLYCTLMCTHVFYWVQPELHQGTMFILLSGILIHKTEKWTIFKGVLLIIALLTGLYSHPLSIFPFLFMGGFLGINKQSLAIQPSVIFLSLAVFALFFLLKNYALPLPYYDVDASEVSRQNFQLYWKCFFKLGTFRTFFSATYLRDYWIFIGSFLGVIGFYGYKKAWLSLFWTASFVLGYFFFITCCYPKNVDQFYIEHLYLPMSFFIAFPLAFDILPNLKNNKMAQMTISILFIIRILTICHADKIYAHRVSYMQGVFEKTATDANKKLLIEDNLVEKRHFIQTWGTAYQALLQSAVESPNNCRQIMFTAEKNYFDFAKNKKTMVLMEFDTLNYQKLPKSYFNIQDTSVYRLVREPQDWLK